MSTPDPARDPSKKTVRLPPEPYPESLSNLSPPQGARTGLGQYQIVDLLRLVIEEGGSDLHLHSGEVPKFRLHGRFQNVEGPPLGEADPLLILGGVLGDAAKQEISEKGSADFAIPSGDFRFRGCIVKTEEGYTAVLRALPGKIPSFKDLGLPDVLQNFTELEKGLVLITGPTGSGKSTTLAAMIEHINQNSNHDTHVLTVEDPIEFRYKPKNATFTQRAVHVHTGSFAQSLKDALRLDPDVILIGEMRDLETTRIAISAAETGHLVFATLHTIGAVKTIDRIISQFPEGEQQQIRIQLAGSLKGVVSQILVPREGGGRIAALEIMASNNSVANHIQDPKTTRQIQNDIQTGSKYGMITLDDYLWALYSEHGAISATDAIHYSVDKDNMMKKIQETQTQ